MQDIHRQSSSLTYQDTKPDQTQSNSNKPDLITPNLPIARSVLLFGW